MKRKPKVGINGFGRIGRAIYRVGIERDLFDVIALNDLNGNLDNLAYLMKYDSLHGVLTDEIKAQGKEILINSSKRIRVFSEPNVESIPWNDLGVEIVIECTGNFKNVANAKQCLGKSVKKVVFSDSPSKHIDFTMVFGVNESEYNAQKHNVIAASICDVVGLAPALKKIEDRFGISSGFVLSLHPWLSYQNVMDNVPKSFAFIDRPWTHHAIGRACVGALIPKNTSLVGALERVIPSIKGKLNGMSFRVPTEVVASASATLMLKESTTTEAMKKYLLSCCKKPMLGYTEEPLISVDYKHHDYSCVVDGKWIEILDGKLIRLVTWYDNEWGYSSRLVDCVAYVYKMSF